MAKNPQSLIKPHKLPLKREFSAGGVVFRKLKNEILFLIIQPKGTDRWQFPKGHIEPPESSQIAAVREVQEEGGVEAKILQKIDIQKYFFVWDGDKIFKTVTFFLMKYLSGDTRDHDKEVEKSVFFDFNRALEKLTYDKDKEILGKAKTLLDKGIQGNLV